MVDVLPDGQIVDENGDIIIQTVHDYPYEAAADEAKEDDEDSAPSHLTSWEREHLLNTRENEIVEKVSASLNLSVAAMTERLTNLELLKIKEDEARTQDMADLQQAVDRALANNVTQGESISAVEKSTNSLVTEA